MRMKDAAPYQSTAGGNTLNDMWPRGPGLMSVAPLTRALEKKMWCRRGAEQAHVDRVPRAAGACVKYFTHPATGLPLALPGWAFCDGRG